MKRIKLTIKEKLALILKLVIGSAISWEVCILFGSKYPYLGPISLILCLQATVIKSIRFGVARIVGTIIGVVFVFILASSLHTTGWSIAIIMLVSLVIPLILGANGTTLHQIALSVLLVFEFEHKLPGYQIDRIRDSVIGVAVALLLHIFLYPPNFTKRAMQEIEAIPQMLALQLKSLAAWLESEPTQANHFSSDTGLLRKKILEAEKRVQEANVSLKVNPFSQKSKPVLQEQELFLQALHQITIDIEALLQIVEKWSKAGSFTWEHMKEWTQNIVWLESALYNWREGKMVTNRTWKGISSCEEFSFPAVWHAQHIVSTIQQHPLVNSNSSR